MSLRALLYRRPSEPSVVQVVFDKAIYLVRLRRHRQARRYTLRIDAPTREVVLTMPPRGSVREAKEFAQKHGGWIAARLKRLPEAAPFAHGIEVPLRGEPHRIVHRRGERGTVWTETDGNLHGGHILPEESIVAESFEVEAFGIDGAMFTAEPDSETNFKLFGPVARTGTNVRAECRAFALRLRPNQDFAAALETFCRQHGILRARIHGGVGSTIGAHFTDGRTVVPFATELAIKAGSVAPGADGTLQAELDVALVDYLGGIAEGRLMRGDNPVLMTMELVLEVV